MKRPYLATILLGLLAVVAGATARGADEEGFEPIFDGKSLAGWEGNPELWSVEDGAITGKTTAEKPLEYNTFLIWRGGEVSNFVLRFQFKLVGGNSGVQYRSWQEPESVGNWVVGGYQADFDSAGRYAGIVYGERFRGILAQRGQKTVIGADHKPQVAEQFGDAAELGKHVKAEQWNDFEVTAQGFHFVHKINGVVMAEMTDEDTEMRRASGIIALQVHKGPPMTVQFRNMRLKRLPASELQSNERQSSQAQPTASSGAKKAPAAKNRAKKGGRAKANSKTKKVVFIAGPPSHGYASHEHNAGCLLLARWLEQAANGIETQVYRNGWPQAPDALKGADAVVIFGDGGGRHPAIDHLAELDRLAQRGAGIACLHYAVEMPKGEAGNSLLRWIGGYFETDWSVNPTFTAEFNEFPAHAVTRGVKPFAIEDEWYYHMRFPADMKNVTPVLTCVPPDSSRQRPDGSHSNNPTVRARRGMPEHVAWVVEREDGGRGFGFTGGHFHWNWAHPSFRKVVLNGIVWVAGMEVPPGGVEVPTPALEELEANLDPKPQGKGKPPMKREQVIDMIRGWQG